MTDNLSQTAIINALQGNWKEAINANLRILKENPCDTEALNRIAKAYFESGNVKRAKISVEKVLKFDPFNPIALKCRDKWKNLSHVDKKHTGQIQANLFLEESGKTKTVHLIHPCDRSVMANINCGDVVHASIKSHRVSLLNEDGSYIGKLPDDISAKIKSLVRIGYRYVFAVKSIENNEIKVFVKEIERPLKYSSKPSFSPDMVDYTPYTPPQIVHARDTENGEYHKGGSANESDISDADKN